jgi:hypothetical protein
MLKRLPFLLASTAWLMATAVHAQSQPASSPPATPPAPTAVAPLTVQAAPGPLIVRKETRQFVQSFAASTPAIDQIARWREPICIQVAGLAADQAARVAARIQEVAEGVGMRALPPGCNANIEVVFTDQPQAFVDKVAASREEVLGYYHRHELGALKTVTRPVQAWYMTATLSNSGPNADLATATIASTSGAISSTAWDFQPKVEVIDDPSNRGPSACGDSPHFTHCLVSELKNVLIVVDTSRLKDKTLGPVTDYLSLLALAQPRSLDGCTALPSVVDLLGPPCRDRGAPDGLTPADAAYLTSLYAANLEFNRQGEENDIASRMASILTNASSRR